MGLPANSPAFTSMAGGLEDILYRLQGGNSYNQDGVLPTVKNPDRAYADLTRKEYLDFVNDYGKFEEDQIKLAQTDTSLIDQARTDVDNASALTAGVQQRNLQRYGGELTAAQKQQMERGLQLGNTLGAVQSMNDARLAQKDLNKSRLSELVNIGQGVGRTALDALGTSAANEVQRKNAYQQAKAASKAQTYSTIASLGSMAIFAMAF